MLPKLQQTLTNTEIVGDKTILKSMALRCTILVIAIAYSIFLLLARTEVLDVQLSSWMFAIGFFLWAVTICILGKNMTWGKVAVVFLLSFIAYLSTTMI